MEQITPFWAMILVAIVALFVFAIKGRKSK